jgi:hypothetical protein
MPATIAMGGRRSQISGFGFRASGFGLLRKAFHHGGTEKTLVFFSFSLWQSHGGVTAVTDVKNSSWENADIELLVEIARP